MMNRFLSRSLILASLGLGSLGALGCDNPAKDKPKADVASPAAETKAAVAGAEALTISQGDSKIEYMGAKVTGKHEGSFQQFSGTIELVPSKIEQSRVKVEVETASVTSDSAKLTGHLKSPDFFDVEKFPKATFVSTEIKPGGENGATHTITGNLELHGVKKSISFPAKITVDPAAVTAVSEFVIKRKDFGIVYPGKPDDLIKDEVVMKLALKAPRKKG